MLLRRGRVLVAGLVALSLSLVTLSSLSAASASRSLDRAYLLRAKDLPYGWTLHQSHVPLGVGCLAQLAANRLSATARANETFVDGGNPPELTELVATFASSLRAYATIVGTLNRCHVVKGVFAHHWLRGRVYPLRLRHFGVASRAYQAEASVEGALLVEDVVVVATTSAVVVVAEGNLGAVDVNQLQSFVTLALRRIPTTHSRQR